ncbi:hypothetical protein Tco_1194556 [Tanacetum coccineum]
MKDKVTDPSSGSNIRIYAIPTATKPPSVVDWKIIPQLGQKAVYQIIRIDGSDKIYMSFGAIIKDFFRDNLTELYSDDAIWGWPLQQKMVNWRGELYFVKFIINPKEDDVEPGIVFGRSFLRLTKGIVDFGNGIITIYPDIITFNDNSDDELDDLLSNIDISDLPPLDITHIPPFMCSMGKNARNKKQPSKNYKMSYDGEGPSLTVNRPLTREELSREELEKYL